MFREKVLAVVAQIPRGKTLTYAQVAAQAGSPHAYRAVGSILKQNFSGNIPCHRVIRSNGEPGKYNRGKTEKIRKLTSEGIKL
ncbi:MAG: MGMT family protein [Patescibacteria group bacterium]